MEDNALSKIFLQLQKSGYKVFGPQEQDNELHILELKNPSQKSPPAPLFKRGGAKGGSIFLPPLQRGSEGDFVFLHPWKYFFTPPRETLYKYEDGKLKVSPQKSEKRALFGMGLFDCKALELYDRVFGYPHPSSPLERGRSEEGDFYYQQNRKNIFVVGYSAVPLEKIKTPFFEIDLANPVRGIKIIASNGAECAATTATGRSASNGASAVFDIFIESLSAPVPRSLGEVGPSRAESANLKFYAQSKKGEEILKKCGIKYKLVKYAPRKDDKKVLAIMKAMEAGKDSKMWDELGEICLACGKCAIACPTCYCFDMESKIGPECQTERCSGNCFYDDFTRIAGGHKFLNNPKEKIFFWYYHKFVRIPHEYGLPGCTDCGRCTAVCPVGINIKKNVERLLKESKKNEK